MRGLLEIVLSTGRTSGGLGSPPVLGKGRHFRLEIGDESLQKPT
jgi:hypothetical protein